MPGLNSNYESFHVILHPKTDVSPTLFLNLIQSYLKEPCAKQAQFSLDFRICRRFR